MSGIPADWTMVALAEYRGVQLVQMPSPGTRILEPDPRRSRCTAPDWLPVHSPTALLVVELPQNAQPADKVFALARGIVQLDYRLGVHGAELGTTAAYLLALRLCARFPWARHAERSTDNPRPDSLFWKPLPDNREVCVYPIFGGARVCISQRDSECIDDSYDYPDPLLAVVAAQLWSGYGDPIDGWDRHIGTGRRREDGDPGRETVRD